MQNHHIMAIKKVILSFIIFFFMLPDAIAKSINSSDWIITEIANFRLISGITNIGSSKLVPLGLEFELKDGWKIYWRNPGGAGYPPEINIEEERNLSKLEWFWPAPKRFSFQGIQNFGYEKKVIFPIRATIPNLEKPLFLTVHVTALACKNICVPLDGKLTLTVPVGITSETQYAALISQYQQLVPTELTWPGFSIVNILSAENSVTINVKSEVPLQEPDVFIETKQNFEFGKPKITVASDKFTASFKLSSNIPKSEENTRFPLTLTFTDGNKFIELKKPLNNSIRASIEVKSASTFQWLEILFAAIVGGMILNFMPCVLPVLTLKLIQVTRKSDAEKHVIRTGFMYSAFGVIFSFLLIAISAIIIKQAGISVGWGMHFQQPIFLGSICLILLAFSGSLFGWFHFKIPRIFLWLESKSSPAITLETKSTNRLDHFLTGAFATVLATPCSAPFVGTALSFALSHGPLEIISIFIAMGIGLSSPYLLICIRPELLRFLPRPGTWMKKLEITLGVLLILTAVWIFTILYQQIDLNWFISGAILIWGAFLTFGLYHATGSNILKVLSLCMPVIALVVIFYADQRPVKKISNRQAFNTGAPIENVIWQEFDPLLITAIIQQGKFVFVDVTADWCLTCKMNKKFVLSSKMVRKLLSKNEIIKMKADWTLPDTAISSYLASYNKFGIPLNIVYGPNAEQGIVLPELLSEEKVFKAFLKAGLQKNDTSQPNYIEKRSINGKSLEK